jgi:hypothetical protein
MKTFDPDKPFTKHRGMDSIHYEQDGCKFTVDHTYAGQLNGKKEPEEVKEDVRNRARAKVAKAVSKKNKSLEGFREPETIDAVSTAVKENEAARKAEENA